MDSSTHNLKSNSDSPKIQGFRLPDPPGQTHPGPFAAGEARLKAWEAKQAALVEKSTSAADVTASPAATEPHGAIQMLQRLDPEGWHNLVESDPERPGTLGQTFPPGSWLAMQEWIERRNGRKNLYFSVNEPVANAPHKKLSKNDIGTIRAVWIDKDPKGGVADFDNERAELQKLVSVSQQGAIPPSWIIDSGSGVQLFWKLSEKLDAQSFGDWAKSQGRGLEQVYKSDAVHNIDRVMRLPGTINLPDAKKKAKGRKRAQARLLSINTRTHSQADLKVIAEPVAKSVSSNPDRDKEIAATEREINLAAIQAVSEFNELPHDLRVRFQAACDARPTLAALWEGDRAGLLGDKDQSGSAYLFALAWWLRRAGGFTPQDFGYLRWVWEHGPIPEKISKREIARAWCNAKGPSPGSEEFRSRAEEAESPRAEEDLVPSVVLPSEITNLPPRPWLYGKKLLRKYVAIVASPGGVGKTAWTIPLALACASGKALLHDPPHHRMRVWIYNLEDDLDEMRRRLVAALRYHDLPESVLSNIRMSSGRNRPLRILGMRKDKPCALPDAEALSDCMINDNIELLILDPYIRSHGVKENENEAQDEVMRVFAKVADRANAAVVLVHHTRKGATAADPDSFRGGSSQVAGARTALTMASMSDKEAQEMGVAPQTRRRYVRIDNVKANMAPPASGAEWIELKSVPLGNRTAEYPEGDEVQVAVKWTPPSAWEDVGEEETRAILFRIEAGLENGERYSARPQDKDRWAGNVIFEVLPDKTEAHAKEILRKWMRTGQLEVRDYQSPAQRKPRKGLFVTKKLEGEE